MVVALARRSVVEPFLSLAGRNLRQRHWREIERTQWCSSDELRAIQQRRLADLLRFAYHNNIFYRERFEAVSATPEDIRSSEDLGRIPLLTKSDVRENAAALISKGYRREDLLEFRTGGSTGKPLSLHITEECSERRNACARRHDRWSGWEVGEPVAAVWGNPQTPRNSRARFWRWLRGPHLFLDTMEVNEASVRKFAADWRRVQPTLLFGHAHSLYLLARYVAELGLDFVRPRAIVSSSMMLLDVEREVIERVFSTRVFNRYGCEEVGLIASECERHEGMHLNFEHLIVESIGEDGLPAAPCQPGRIVVTDLLNLAMPFIRYQVEDEVTLLTSACPCGRGLPLLGKVTGRLADFLVKPDGSRVAGVSLVENTLTRVPHVEQMQIIQESICEIRLRIVPGRHFGEDERGQLMSYFSRLFGPSVTVFVDLVPNIAPAGSARKFRFCISNVRPGSGGLDG